MRVLHVLPTGGMGWSGGIRPTLRSLAEADALSHHSFELTGLRELPERIAAWKPDVLAWHVACSWRHIPRLLRARPVPLLIFEHHYCAGFEKHNVPSAARFRTMLRLSYRMAHRVVAVSHRQQCWMQNARLVQPQRQRRICSSRRLEPFEALAAPPVGAPGGPIRLLAYGRFSRQKGFDRLIRALSTLPHAPLRLNVVGDGPQRRELEQLAADDDRIRIGGASADIPKLLDAADVVVIPSRWEPWGNVCLEARAAGRPVLVTDSDGLPEQVRDCGLVVAAATDDSEAVRSLAQGLETLHQTTPEQRRQWSEAARQSARNAWAHYVSDWAQLLDTCR